MALEPAEALARATDAAREEDAPEGWTEVAAGVRARLRSLLPPSHPLLVVAADGSLVHDQAGSRTFIADRLVRDALRELLQAHPTHAPDDIRLLVEDDRLRGVEVDLVAAYGVPLPALGEAVRTEVLTTLRGLVGPDPELGPGQVAVRFVDVSVGDPNEAPA